MMPPPLEDRLNRLADHVAAPATADARQAIGRRTARLRRRRQVRNAAGAGLVALLVLAGAAALQAKDPDVETDIAGPRELPALTVDLDGWQVAAAGDTTAAPDTTDVYDPASGSLQVFRQPGNLAGPSIFLRHEEASDVVAEKPAAERVTVDGSQGYLEQTGPDSFTVSWNPAQTDSQAYLEARGLKRGEVVDFANGLRVTEETTVRRRGARPTWRQTDDATVVASFSGADRSTVEDFMGGLDEISEGEWQDLVATHPAPATTQSTVPAP